MCYYSMHAKQHEDSTVTYAVYYDDNKEYDSEENNLFFKTLNEAEKHCESQYNTEEDSFRFYQDPNWNTESREDCLKAVSYYYSNLQRFPKFFNDKEIVNIARITYEKNNYRSFEQTIENWKRWNHEQTEQGKKELAIKKIKELMIENKISTEELA